MATRPATRSCGTWPRRSAPRCARWIWPPATAAKNSPSSCPARRLADAVSAGERIRAAIAEESRDSAAPRCKSPSRSALPRSAAMTTRRRLISRADEALYAAKEGRPEPRLAPRRRATAPAAHADAAASRNAATGRRRPAAPGTGRNRRSRRTCQSIVRAMDSRSPTAFCTDLKRRVLECQKFAVPLTLVLLDIDDFKPLVDNLGTSARELVVNTLSEFLTMSLHDIDVVSHYGDGHFAIMMPGTELGGAIKMAERLRSVISSCCVAGPRRGAAIHAQPGPGPSPVVGRSPFAGQTCRCRLACLERGRRQLCPPAHRRTLRSRPRPLARPPAKRGRRYTLSWRDSARALRSALLRTALLSLGAPRGATSGRDCSLGERRGQAISRRWNRSRSASCKFLTGQ